MGRFVKDPELRTTQNGKSVCSFTLACERDRQPDVVDYVDCVAWDKSAEFICRNFFKGKAALACGSFQSRKWQDNKGNNRISWELLTQEIYFCDERRREADVTAHDFAEYTTSNEELPF